MADIRVLEEIRTAGADQRRSAQWYQDQVKSIVGTSYAATRFQQDYAENMTGRMLPGRMYLMNYSNLVHYHKRSLLKQKRNF